MEMKVNLEPLTKAILRLEEGLKRYEKDTSDEQIRDGLIQRFEFTYEISHSLLRRYLKSISSTPDEFHNQVPFQFVIRSGNKSGLLLSDWPQWSMYRQLRGKTSHTYDKGIALQVVADIPKFLDEVRYLHEQLSKRI